MIDPSERARLIEIVRQRSFGTGVEIKLASGRISDFYFDMKPTMLDPEGATLIGRLLVGLVAEKGLADRVDMVGGLEMGAVPIATAVAMASHEAAGTGKTRGLPAFFVRKQPKGHGTAAAIDGFVRGDTIAGRRVLVVEDVTTTGGSAMKAIEAIRAAGGVVVGVATVVDRLEGAAESFASAHVPFWPLLTVADFR